MRTIDRDFSQGRSDAFPMHFLLRAVDTFSLTIGVKHFDDCNVIGRVAIPKMNTICP